MNYINRTRLLFWCCLVFSFWVGCRNQGPEEIKLGWEDKRVKKIHIPLRMFPEKIDPDRLLHVRISLASPGSPAILGDYSKNDEFITFEPLIPFTTGLTYEIQYKQKKIKQIQIPAPQGKQKPAITAIYPNEDSLPENLLKIYIGFSQPMREGVSAKHVVLVKDGKDTLQDVFLDLQPELWNNDRTMLTLWLNPGRTKRDLIPNQEQGPPLEAGKRYQILIKKGWQDTIGDSLATSFEKNFVTVTRDSRSPTVEDWTVTAPKEGTLDPVTVHLKEPLDYQVLKKALYILDEREQEKQGKIDIADDEKTWRFTPFSIWQKGKYKINALPILEDLAGNNLERLFDRDAQGVAVASENKSYRVFFEIR